MNGYPEPHHIYLGKSSIIVLTFFPKPQAGHPLQNSSEYEQTKGRVFYDASQPLRYDIEIRHPFNEKDGVVFDDYSDVDEWYLAKDVSFDEALHLSNQFIEEWCAKHGLAIL